MVPETIPRRSSRKQFSTTMMPKKNIVSSSSIILLPFLACGSLFLLFPTSQHVDGFALAPPSVVTTSLSSLAASSRQRLPQRHAAPIRLDMSQSHTSTTGSHHHHHPHAGRFSNSTTTTLAATAQSSLAAEPQDAEEKHYKKNRLFFGGYHRHHSHALNKDASSSACNLVRNDYMVQHMEYSSPSSSQDHPQYQHQHPTHPIMPPSSIVESDHSTTTSTSTSRSAHSPTAGELVADSFYSDIPALVEDDDDSSTKSLLSSLQQQYPVQERVPSTISTTLESVAAVDPTTASDAVDRSVMVARLLLIAAAALYGTNFSLVKLMGQGTELPVGVSSTLRFGLAAVATSPWLLRPAAVAPVQDPSLLVKDASAAASVSSSREDSSDDMDSAVSVVEEEKENDAVWGSFVGGFEVGLWTSIGYIAQAVGLETTTASESAFLCSLAVVVVPFLDFLAGRQLKGREWVGAITALAGVAFLEFGGVDFSGSGAGLTWSYGDWASMLQPLFFGMGFWRMEHIMHKYPNEASRCTAAQLLAVAVGSAVYSAVAEPGAWNVDQLQTWLSDPSLLAMIAWTGIASTAFSVYMETRALQTLSASETTLLLSTEPLWGAGFAALLIGEQFGVDSAIGGALILGGCLYSSLGLAGLWKSFVVPFTSRGQRNQIKNGSWWMLPWLRTKQQ